MSLPTTRVNFSLANQLGDNAPGAIVRWLLTRPDIDDETGTTIKPRMSTAVADEHGDGHIDPWPNERGRRASQYQIEIYRPGQTRPLWTFKITVPAAGPVDLTGIISEDPFPAKSESQVALEAAQAASAEAIQAKTEAEAAALAASNSAGDAEASSQAAQTAATAAGNAQTAAEAAQAAAETAQGLAESARNDSQAARDAAQLAQTAAETARDAALAAQSAAETARDAAIAAQSGAEAARDQSQAWAEGIEPGGPGTKSSQGHAQDSAASATAAEGFKDEAETAAAKIPDATSEDAGQVPQTDGADGYELRNLQDAVFLYGSGFRIDNVVAADNFNRPDGVLHGTTDMRGNVYSVVDGTTADDATARIQVVDRVARRVGFTASHVFALYPRPAGSLTRKIDFTMTANEGNAGFWGWCPAWLDNNNWAWIGGVASFHVGVRVCIDGVTSNLIENSVVMLNSADKRRGFIANFVVTIGSRYSGDNPLAWLLSGPNTPSPWIAFDGTQGGMESDVLNLINTATHEGFVLPASSTSHNHLIHSFRAVQWQAS